MEPSWLPQTPEILYINGFVVCEFWKTFNSVKSETTYEYINKKKDISEKIKSPITLIFMKFDFLFIFETKNWEIEKNRDNKSDRFPKNGTINWIYITTF